MLRAAISAGAHYLDLTGEPRYVATLLADFGDPASVATRLDVRLSALQQEV